MNGKATGKLTLLKAPDGERKQALLDYLAKYQKNASREKLEEMIGNLPLVLGRNVPEQIAGRIAADLEALGAKLQFSPAPVTAEVDRACSPAAAEPAATLRELLLNEAFTDEKIQFPISHFYRAGLLLVALAMVLLPFVYLGIIAGAGYLLLWHATANAGIFATSDSIKGALFLYLTPLVVGILLIFFMVKPLFARRSGTHRFYEVKASDEPLLHDFIGKVCAAVGAPMPGRIRIDTQVNASAGFRRGILSFAGRDLVLTIGLPLAGGLNIREFAGVLAHEFGHFAQASGMRLTYIIRSINYWFSKVVYDEDMWDVRLRRWSRQLDFRIALILWVARFFIWIGKKVLLMLMKAGHLISCFMLRQMEFDADRYEAALVGAEVFESTCGKLALLTVAHSWAFEDLTRCWEEGRLVNNLPELVMANLRQIKEETKADIFGSRATGKTGAFDTHPADADRVASVRTVSRVPVFSWPAGRGVKTSAAAGADIDGTRSGSDETPPATVLFRDFPALSRQVTMDYYRVALGSAPDPKSLVDAEEIVRSQDEEQKYFAALERYFLGRFNPWLPLGIGARRLFAPHDAGEARRMIDEMREKILRQDQRHGELLEQFFRLADRITQAANARALLEAGFTIKPKDFNLPGAGLGDAEMAAQRYSDRENELFGEIGKINSLYRDRLTLGLQQLQSPSAADRNGNGEETSGDINTLREAMIVLEDSFPLLRRLLLDFRRLAILTRQIENNESNERLAKAIGKGMDILRQDMGLVRQGVGNVPYPFDHAGGEMTLGAFIVSGDFDSCGLGELLGAAETAIDRLPRTYARIAARLAHMAEEAEKIHGLAPLK